MMTPSVADALRFIDTRRDDLIGFLRTLIATPSITIEMGEQAIADVVVGRTRDLGLADPEVRWAREEHPNLIYRAHGSTSGPTLILNGHLDTQPVEDGASWSYDPFEGHVVCDAIIGDRGRQDLRAACCAVSRRGIARRHSTPTGRCSSRLGLRHG